MICIFVDSNPPTPITGKQMTSIWYEWSAALHCGCEFCCLSFWTLLWTQLREHISCYLAQTQLWKSLSLSTFCLCIIALCTFVLTIVLTELILSDSSLKVSRYCNAYGARKLMVRMDCLIVNYLQIVWGLVDRVHSKQALCVKWEFLSMLYNI